MKFVLLVLAFLHFATFAQTNKELDAKVKSLEEKFQSLTNELANIKTVSSVPELSTSNSFMGLGQSASKVYFSKSPLSIGGYGEFYFQDNYGTGNTDKTDMYRLVPYLSYRYSDKIIFNSEIEFEHSNEVAVEFAYVDFLVSNSFAVRAGHVLVPVGISNLKHEPIYFSSVLRPELETKLIPSTWHENGVLVYGETGPIRYQAGVLNGLKVTKATGTTSSNLQSSSWIREGRQWNTGSAALAEDLAYVARVDYLPMPGTEVGASYYLGDSSQNDESFRGQVRLWEGHVEWEGRGFEVKSLYASGALSDADQLSSASNPIGSRAEGYYISVGYDWLKNRAKNQALVTFARYSEYDLHKEVPEGFTRSGSLDKQIWTVGVNYRPDPQVVVKGDFEKRKEAANSDDDRTSLGIGFVF